MAWELALKGDLSSLEAKITALQADIQALKDAPTIPDGIEERIEALESLTNASGVATAWSWFSDEIFTRYPSTQRPTNEGLGYDKTKIINGGNYVSNDGRLRVESGARVAYIDSTSLVDVVDNIKYTGYALTLISPSNTPANIKNQFIAIKVNGKAKIKGVIFSNKTSCYFYIYNSAFSKIYEKNLSATTKNQSYGFEFDYNGGNMSQGDTLYLTAAQSTALGLRQLKVNC